MLVRVALGRQIKERQGWVDQAEPRRFLVSFDVESDSYAAAAGEWDELVRPGLEEGKLAALGRLEATASEERLGEDDAGAWLTALNDLRLVLGTRLGVTEETYVDETGPRTPGMMVYVWLTWLQGELVEALSKGL